MFETLKSALTSAEVTPYYDFHAETRFIVDASPEGLGAILEKKHKGNSRIVAYARHTLNT